MKRLPDLLTASRGIIAVIVALLGLVGPDALEWVILLIIIGWTTDIMDGRLARKYQKEATWIGDREFAFDMIMVLGGLCYLVLAGFIPLAPAAAYVGVATLFIAYFRSKMVTMSFAFPVVALPLIVAYFNAPRAAWIFIAWIVLALLYDWKRFKGVVLEFIENAKALSHR
ncbi:hypothetical protein DRJ12_02880 [Candidatus Acetothermia bacterium]|nr:MAG: hypothetical protein DRJ12_02880 [Candidatus Acetothermia bacterium]